MDDGADNAATDTAKVSRGNCCGCSAPTAPIGVGLDETKKASGPRRRKIPKVKLSIEGMMCQKSCGTTVENSLRAVDGVERAVADFTTHSATIWGTASVSDLIDAVEMVGFGAELMAVDE